MEGMVLQDDIELHLKDYFMFMRRMRACFGSSSRRLRTLFVVNGVIRFLCL